MWRLVPRKDEQRILPFFFKWSSPSSLCLFVRFLYRVRRGIVQRIYTVRCWRWALGNASGETFREQYLILRSRSLEFALFVFVFDRFSYRFPFLFRLLLPVSLFGDVQAKKRPSGSNIADFYGRGDSDSDEEETAFNMDSYSKGVLLSQAAEVGTHTEDGQLRPQVRIWYFTRFRFFFLSLFVVFFFCGLWRVFL